jgi:hypothetical protein
MPPLPVGFVDHLNEFRYHPRSDRHSNALGLLIVEDLLARCPLIKDRASKGLLTYDVNMDLRVGSSTWNVDLVIGTPAVPVDLDARHMIKATPSTVQIAIEIKSVMTEHRKAVKNRKRDFEAHHEHVHHYGDATIAGGVMVVNAASDFQSPLRVALTKHGSVTRVSELLTHCVNEMRNVTERSSMGAVGMDAKTLLIVDFQNVGGATAQFVEKAPAPLVGDPLHYDSFIQRICSIYTFRFP